MRLPGSEQFGRILKWAGLGLCVAFVVIQFVPVNRTNPPVESDVPADGEVRSVLRRACYDCHSNETVWPWYSRIAPVSWIIAYDVREGRAELNFSTWNQLSPDKQAKEMRESWKEVAEGEMPTWFYVVLHPEAKLSPADKSVLQTWSASAAPAEAREHHD